MADISAISNAATALTEGMKIYGDIQTRQRRAESEQAFADRVNAAGGVENLSYEELMGASDFLDRQQMNIGKQSIQNRMATEALEANRKYNEEKIQRERDQKRADLFEQRTYEEGLLSDKLGRQATEESEKTKLTAELLADKQARDDRLLQEKQTRTDELRDEGRTYAESQKIADREYPMKIEPEDEDLLLQHLQLGTAYL